MSERIYLNNDWKFAEQFEASMTEAAYDDSAMQNVRLPHTCKETPLHYFDEHCYLLPLHAGSAPCAYENYIFCLYNH